MSNQRIILLVINFIIIVIVLGIAAFEKETGFIEGIHPAVFLLLIVISMMFALRPLKRKDHKNAGLPVDDELSLSIKYEAGYYAYLITMFIWIIIFLFKERFPNSEVMLGVGILLSALSAIVSRLFIKWKSNG
jgi:hypothetical protein